MKRRDRPEAARDSAGQPDRAAFRDGWTAHALPARGRGDVEQRLIEADPKLGAVITRLVAARGCLRFKPSRAASHFDAVARSIVYQQLSQTAAASIYSRYVAALGGAPGPAEVLRADPRALRASGLSRTKVHYLKALAEAAGSGDLNLARLENLPDEAVVEQLTRVPGVGVWTAQMFLMFHLRRPDVLPVQDAGIQRGLQAAHGLRRPAAPGYIRRAGSRWRPYRSIACLYLWAGLERSP